MHTSPSKSQTSQKLTPSEGTTLLSSFVSEFNELTILRQNYFTITLGAAHKKNLQVPVIIKCLNTFSREYHTIKDEQTFWFLREIALLQALKNCNNVIQMINCSIDDKKLPKWYTLPLYHSLEDLPMKEPQLYKSISVEKFILDIISGLDDGYKKCGLLFLTLVPDCIGYMKNDDKFVITSWENACSLKNYADNEPNQKNSKLIKTFVDNLLYSLSSNNYSAPEFNSTVDFKSIPSKLNKSAIFSLALISLDILGVHFEKWRKLKYATSNYEKQVSELFPKGKCSSELQELLMSMLSRNPEDRPNYESIIEKAHLMVYGSPISLREDTQAVRDQVNIYQENSLVESQFITRNDDKFQGKVVSNNEEENKGIHSSNTPKKDLTNTKTSPKSIKMISDETMNSHNGEQKSLPKQDENLWSNSKDRVVEVTQNFHTQPDITQENIQSSRNLKDDKSLNKTNKPLNLAQEDKDSIEVNSSPDSKQEHNDSSANDVINNLQKNSPKKKVIILSEEKANCEEEEKKATSNQQKAPQQDLHPTLTTNIQNAKPSEEITQENSVIKTQQNTEEEGKGGNTQSPVIQSQQHEKRDFTPADIITYENGDTYQGGWSDGKWHGQGLWTSGDKKSSYEGNYAFGKRDGKGRMQYSNGDVYEGNWQQGKKHGKGNYHWASDGSHYKGDWKEDKRDGVGFMKYTNGDKYMGNWRNDNFEGKGYYLWSDGRKYEGMFSNGKFEGQGKMKYPDGDYYNGNWKNDLYEGEGEYYVPEEKMVYKIFSKEGEIQVLSEETLAADEQRVEENREQVKISKDPKTKNPKSD